MLQFTEGADLSISFRHLSLVAFKKSKVHDIAIYRHPLLGKLLVIDNEVQHVEIWSPFYHEMVVHWPVSFIPVLRKVLILGGGSLYAASEVLKYKTVEKVLMIDHDKEVINLVSKKYSHAKNILKNDKFEFIENDAFQELRGSREKYDLIINDAIDLFQHGRDLGVDLFELLSTKLNPGGVCSDLIYRNIFERKTTQRTIKKLNQNFSSLFSLVTVPEYPGIFHLLSLWSKSKGIFVKTEIKNEVQKDWLAGGKNSCKFYDPKFQSYYRYLPRYLSEILK